MTIKMDWEPFKRLTPAQQLYMLIGLIKLAEQGHAQITDKLVTSHIISGALREAREAVQMELGFYEND